jgi:hypothetical protein
LITSTNLLLPFHGEVYLSSSSSTFQRRRASHLAATSAAGPPFSHASAEARRLEVLFLRPQSLYRVVPERTGDPIRSRPDSGPRDLKLVLQKF